MSLKDKDIKKRMLTSHKVVIYVQREIRYEENEFRTVGFVIIYRDLVKECAERGFEFSGF